MATVIKVKCYVYDVVFHLATMEEHVKNLEKVMSLLHKHGLRVRLSKFFLIKPRVQLMDHAIGRYGVRTAEIRLNKVRNAQPPGDLKDLRSFHGLASYYR